MTPWQKVKLVPASSFTSRQREIIQRFAEGETYKSIAVALGISEKTVSHDRSEVLRKLGLLRHGKSGSDSHTALLTRLAHHYGLIQVCIMFLFCLTSMAQPRLQKALAVVKPPPVTNAVYFVATATQGVMESDYSTELQAMTTNNTITVEWDAVAGADYYKLYWGANTRTYQWAISLSTNAQTVFVRPQPLVTNYQPCYAQLTTNLTTWFEPTNKPFLVWTSYTGGLTPQTGPAPFQFSRIRTLTTTNSP